MVSFTLSLIALIIGYLIYGRYITRVFGPDGRPTPAYTKADGVDYIVMPVWKIFMIQFLNIAGTGPIFGAIMGALFGPSAFLWIVFGCIFAGSVHDYLSGMISLRNGGESLPEMIGRYLGSRTKTIMLIFTILLLILVGAVFVYSPALLLADLTPKYLDAMFWIVVVFIYYVLATLLPIDKIIGKIYPLFAFALLFMAAGLLVCLFVHWPAIPELWSGLASKQPQGQPIFPCLFITIACGAISGFHATQSPLMARCIKHEKYGYPVFYGAMITEGIVALIWAAVAAYFFYDPSSSRDLLTPAPKVVEIMSKEWLGTFGGVLAILGVVAAPITSGDTAFRSARLIIADFLHINQKGLLKRLYIAIPLFVAAVFLLFFNLSDPKGFQTVWGYFAWANQTLSVFTLWAITVFLVRTHKPYIITLIPALFMTTVCTTYLFISKTVFGLSEAISYGIGCGALIISIIWFCIWFVKQNKNIKA